MSLIADLINRLTSTSRTTAVESYEITDEPDLPAWRSPKDGRQLFVRPERAEVTFVRYGEGPWRFRELAVIGRIVGTGLRGPGVRYQRRKDVPDWLLPALTPPDELELASEGGS
jgi:hypothetical protein